MTQKIKSNYSKLLMHDLENSYFPEAWKKADTVIVNVNKDQPWPENHCHIHISKVLKRISIEEYQSIRENKKKTKDWSFRFRKSKVTVLLITALQLSLDQVWHQSYTCIEKNCFSSLKATFYQHNPTKIGIVYKNTLYNIFST